MPTDKTCLIVTPYSLRKGRTGAILSRLLSRTDLTPGAVRVFAAPDDAFGLALADALGPVCPCLKEYAKTRFTPANGVPARFFSVILEGENALEKMREVVGCPNASGSGDGSTIRDSYADLVKDADGKIVYFEPGVIVPENASASESMLELLAGLAEATPNLVETHTGEERTLVIFKPENWRRNSVRPGAIMDIFTRTGLRLIGCKMLRMPVSDALEFYGPVREALRSKLAPKIAERAKSLLEKEFSVRLRNESGDLLLRSIGFDYADDQFFRIVEFMSGTRPDGCPDGAENAPGRALCMVAVLEGPNAVAAIRDVLGPTDPAKAEGGTVRGEFGSNVMVNAAHASDSPESFRREAGILKVTENAFAAVARA